NASDQARSEAPATTGPNPPGPCSTGRVLEASRLLARAPAPALREPHHRAAAFPAAVRDALRSRGDKRALHGTGRRPPSRRGSEDPRAGGGTELGHPARRHLAPRTAEASAARLPRREDAAAGGAHDRADARRGRVV